MKLSPYLRAGARFGVLFALLSGLLPRAEAGTYTQSYTFPNGTTDLGDGSSIRSNNNVASVQNNRLRLTQNGVGNSLASYRLPVLDPGREIESFSMEFDLTLFETPGGNPPADGFSINFGAIPPVTADPTGSGEEGWTVANGLVIAFDTWDNGGEPPAIEVKANGLPVRSVTLASIDPQGNFLNFFDNESRKFIIQWDSSGIDITYGNRQVMVDQPTPGFIPKIGDYFAFSGRTGGATEDVFFDNMNVRTTIATPLNTGGPVISEILVDNDRTLEDEDCDSGAWLEIYNGQDAPLNLEGWALTNSSTGTPKWTFPAVTVPAYTYYLVWVDGKNRSTGTNLHADFSLVKAGGYVALLRPDGTVASSLTYPAQSEDVSYGRKGTDQTIGFFETPSPRLANRGEQSPGGPIKEEVQFSRTGGLITEPVLLTATAPTTTGAVIRYTIDGTIPSASSPVYPTAGLNVNGSMTVRARIFAPDRLPGPVTTRGFILLDTSLTNYRGSGPFTSNLPIIVLHSFGAPIDSMTGSPGRRPFIYSYIAVLDKNTENGRVSITGATDFTNRVGIHVRGETSAGFAQRPYSIEFWDNQDRDKDASILGLPADSDWALISNYNDKSLIRNKLPFDTMFETNGEGSAMRERYVEVFFRQDNATGPLRYTDYRGVYVLTERIKRHKNRVDIDRLKPCDGVFTNNPAVDDVGVISGGYIFRKDKDPQDNPFVSSRGVPFQIVEPDPPSTAQRDYLRDYVNRFEAALYGANFTDPATGYAKYIDPKTFIDNHLWVEITKQIDGYRLSTYYTKDRAERIKAFPIWDYNLSQGNANYLEGQNPRGWYYTQVGGADYHWYPRLFQDPKFLRAYWDRYWQLRRGIFSNEAIIARIDAYVNQLSDGQPSAVITNDSYPTVDVPASRHHSRWRRLGVYDWPNADGFQLRTRWNSPLDVSSVQFPPPSHTATGGASTTNSEIAHVKTWLLQRLMWMDTKSMTYGDNNAVGVMAPDFNQYGGPVPEGFQLTMSHRNANGDIFYTTDGTDPMPANMTADVVTIIPEGANAQYIVPSTTNGGSSLTIANGDANQWNNVAPPPNANNWRTGPMGFGFDYVDIPPIDFTPFIKTDVRELMQPTNGDPANATLYVRIPFTLTPEQTNSLVTLKLKVRYDDSYIAYLNGVEVARKNVLSTLTPAYDSASGLSRPDSAAIIQETVDLTNHVGLLRENNVLAIHAMNAIASGASSAAKDFLISPALEGEKRPQFEANKYSAPITISGVTHVKARVLSGLTWGPLTEAVFLPNAVPASAANLVVSKLHYHPLDPTAEEMTAGANNQNDFEYLELMNISNQMIDMTGVRVTEGIAFNWADAPVQAQRLAPGARMLIVENAAAFALRHPNSGALIAGSYVGNLSNGGEAIRIVAANGADIKYFTYDDDPPWPVDADGGRFDAQGNRLGGGYALVLIDPRSNPDHNVAGNWRSSAQLHGLPGRADTAPFAGNPIGDLDGDGLPDLVNYATGMNGSNGRGLQVARASYNVGGTVGEYLTLTLPRSLSAEGVVLGVQISQDLRNWQNAGDALVYVGSRNNGDGTESMVYRTSQPVGSLPPQFYVRLNVSQR